MKVAIGLADDHQLFLKSLSMLINSMEPFEVTLQALNGEDLLHKLETANRLPAIQLIDVDMPTMGGEQAARQIAARFPLVKTVALSMKDDDNSILGMIRAGCCAYLLKDIHPDELERALVEIHTKGFYNADSSNINYRRLLLHAQHENNVHITDKEKAFLQLASSDLTYKQIASEMGLSERTVDGYRETLFEKLNVQSRVGMVLEGLRRSLVHL